MTYCHDIKVYQDSRHPTPSTLKGNSRFEILLVKIFSLKQKHKSNTSSNYRKELNFVSSGNQVDLGIFKGISAYSGIFKDIQAYSGIMRHIQQLFTHIFFFCKIYATKVPTNKTVNKKIKNLKNSNTFTH